MKKLLTTLVAFAALILGSLAFTPTPVFADADDTPPPSVCVDDEPCSDEEPPACVDDEPCPTDTTTCVAPTPPAATVNGDDEQLQRVTAVADRRAATIQRLRAKIRALR